MTKTLLLVRTRNTAMANSILRVCRFALYCIRMRKPQMYIHYIRPLPPNRVHIMFPWLVTHSQVHFRRLCCQICIWSISICRLSTRTSHHVHYRTCSRLAEIQEKKKETEKTEENSISFSSLLHTRLQLTRTLTLELYETLSLSYTIYLYHLPFPY